MRKALRFLVLSLLSGIPIYLSFCRNPSNANNEEKVFKNYIHNQKLNINPGYHIFFISPTLKCKPCVKKYIKVLDANTGKLKFSEGSATFITTQGEFIPNTFCSEYKCFFDQQKTIDKLNIDQLFNFCVIEFRNMELTYIKSFGLEDIRQFKNKYFTKVNQE